MNKALKLVITVCFFGLVFSNQLFSQRLTQFSQDSVKYIKELNDYFYDFSANKVEGEEFVRNFQKSWKLPEFTGRYKTIVYKVSNIMLKRNYKPFPYFTNYLTSVVNFIASKQPVENFDNWQLCADKILVAKNAKMYDDFLEMSVNVFTGNVFYKSPTYEFKSSNNNYKFEYDTTAKILFPNLNLTGVNPRGDSITIENTQGIYYISKGRFVGKAGKVSWKRTGLDDVYADLVKYTIDCKTGGYSADSVTFTGKQFFDKSQKGSLIDKIITENGDPTYPRFDSYSKRLLVKNIYPDVDYDGGFGIRGPKFVGSGNAQNPARLIYRRNNIKFMELSARSFSMTKDKINAKPASVKIYLDKDSIIHPGLSFVYQVDKKTLTLVRTEDGLEKSPYYNTFHNIDMYFEQLVWKIDEPKIDFNFLPNNFQGEAFFESSDFYKRDRVDDIKGQDPVNPISKMNDYYNSNGKLLSFTTVDFAKYLKYTAVDLRPIIFKMAIFGLINYEPETDIITIRQRLFDYYKNAKHEHDYDILTVHSVFPGKENATLSLLNYDLNIRGVKQILLSDTQKVFIFPKKQEITLKKNRVIDFSGVIASGKFEFHGKDFVFDYEQFKIKMKTIDSLKIYVVSVEPDVNGNYPMRLVQTIVENLNGELKIDAPKNHSGWGKAPTFPSFQSFKESYAFYDKKQIFKGVYNRDKFYFKLDPFTIDSLDNFRNESLVFDGEFSSAGVFPVFREKISLQKDYSLGFIRNTPPGGFQVYGGKAKFENEIRLSNKGLRADGVLNYVTSTTVSKDFIFFPDSMNTTAQSFDVKEQINPIEFPQVHGDTVYIHWSPYKDRLNATDKIKPFICYNSKADFTGTLTLAPQELRGRGKVDLKKADVVAKNILFKQHVFSSDTSNFHLKTVAAGEDGLSFSSDNVKSLIDFEKKEGTFVANGKASIVRFPKNQYIAYMDRFKWFMETENIQLGDESKKLDPNAENALNLEGPEFISVHPKQDSLRFFAPAALYDVKKYVITAINVPFINVADARVFPDSGKVIVRRDANIDELNNSSILANTVTKYHTIKNVKAKLFSRKNYLASGDYEYVDENNKSYLVKFSTIKPDTTGQTVSEGEISEKENFKFNDYFSFAGKVKLFASNQFLTFEGGTRIVHACSKLGKSYLQFSGEINPKEILIPLPKEPKDMSGNKIASGIVYSADTNMVYSAFVSPRGSRSDKDVLLADGFLGYDRATKEYRISNKEKLVEQSLPGNYLSLNTTNCTVYGEGKMDLGADLGQVKTEMFGNVKHVTINDSVSFELMMTLDFFFNDNALKKMTKDIGVFAANLTPIDFGNAVYTKGLTELMGKERADKTISDLNLYGNYKKFPDELKKTFVIGYTKMKYDKASRSFLSDGQIGLCNIYKEEFFKYVPGKIQIKRQKSGDIINIYFELDENTWYYFSYFKGVMKVVSSNQEFNTIIRDMKGKDRKQDVEKGPSFQYNIASPTLRSQFLSKLKQTGATEEE